MASRLRISSWLATIRTARLLWKWLCRCFIYFVRFKKRCSLSGCQPSYLPVLFSACRDSGQAHSGLLLFRLSPQILFRDLRSLASSWCCRCRLKLDQVVFSWHAVIRRPSLAIGDREDTF